MVENLILSLQITVIGMGLVFLSLTVLWGIMVCLVRLTNRQAAHTTQVPEVVNEATDETKLIELAATAAVAIALAQQADEGTHFPLPPTRIVSAWQVVMRTNMLNKRGSVR